MELTSPRLKFNENWPIAMVCVFALLMIVSVTFVATSSAFISEVAKGTLYIKDSQSSYDLKEIISLADSDWEVERSDRLSYGMPAIPYWFKFSIPSQSSSENSRPVNQLLELDYALLDNVDIWFLEEDQIVGEYHVGDTLPFEQRGLKSEKFVFAVPQSKSDLTVIIKASTTGNMNLPLRIWDEQQYAIYNGERNLALGLFFGFLAAMALSNLFFFVTTGSVMFLTYSMYVIFIGITLATYHGISFKFLWPDSVWFQSRSATLFGTITLLMATLFSDQILNAKKHSPTVHRLFKISAWTILFFIVVRLILPNELFNPIFPVLLCLGLSLVLFASVYLLRKGVKIARFYLLAWSALLITGFLASFESANMIKLAYPSHYLLIFGASIETFLLAFALAIAYSQQRDEQFKSQELALLEERMARESQDEVLKLKEQTQEELEYKVQERTLELEITLRELSDTNRELEQQTLTDALTGIRNRKHFDKKYIAEVRRSRREQTELAIVMLDIDNFKKINDAHGHIVGDEVIKFVASALKQSLKRTTDDACRYGGEEFALILPNTDLKGATLVAERLREMIESEVIEFEDVQVKVTISAGVCSSVMLANEDENALLEQADKALYEAKRAGRNQVIAHCLKSRDTI